MKKLYTFIFIGIVALFTSISCGTSRTVGLEAGWEVLGERKVNFVRDRDAIEVRSRERFTAIRFRVEDKNIRLRDLTIQFQSGDRLSPAIDDVIEAGQSSRIIELARDGRVIDKIEFSYRTMGSILSGRAKVLVLGQRYVQPY